MGTERESAVLAAGEKIEVDGKEYRLRPIVVQHLMDLEQDALRSYKRQVLSTYSENADLLGNGEAASLIKEKFAEVSKWGLEDLPQKDAYSVSGIEITDDVRKWVEENYDEVPDTDDGIRSLLVTALDSEKISSKELNKLCGGGVIHGRVRYDQWWVTATVEGMISFITSSIRYDSPEITTRDVSGWPFLKLAEASRIVERLTSANLGNT